MHSLSDLKRIDFKNVPSKEASLFIYEGNQTVPFMIQRSFVVKAVEACDRGKHAHKKCAQLLVALNGTCVVTCDDGDRKKEIILNTPAQGLLIPCGIWAEQKYESHTILMVLADMPYDEDDYLRDYQEFLDFRKKL